MLTCSPQSRSWIGTSYLEVFGCDPALVEYLVYQREKCPKTGRLHWQFFVVFKLKKRLRGVKSCLGECHVEIARDLIKSRLYCMKEESRQSCPIEIGVFNIREKESMVSILRKRSICDILEEYPNLWRNVHHMRLLQSEFQQPRRTAPITVILTGESGRGKTTIMQKICSFLGDTSCYWKSPTKWWDGYFQQPLVCWDEFRGELSVSDFLLIFNSAPHQVEKKGGTLHLNSPWFLLSSNLTIEQMYGSQDFRSFAAIKRRIKQYIVY